MNINDVTEKYNRTYSFVLKQAQRIHPNYLTNNRITGDFEWGLKQAESEDVQIWNLKINDLQFDWNPNAVAETYFLFAFPSCIDIKINKEGSVIGGDTDFNICEAWNKTCRNELYERIKDKEQADRLFDAINGSQSKELAVELIKINPITSALCNVVKLNYNLKYNNEEAGEFGERFTGEIEKSNYFFNDIGLPLKTTWLKRALSDEREEEWSHLGGLAADKYKESEMRQKLRLLTGEQNPAIDTDVNFIEVYRMDKLQDDFRLPSYGLFQTSTQIETLWEKAEECEIIAKKTKEQEQYGTV